MRPATSPPAPAIPPTADDVAMFCCIPNLFIKSLVRIPIPIPAPAPANAPVAPIPASLLVAPLLTAAKFSLNVNFGLSPLPNNTSSDSGAVPSASRSADNSACVGVILANPSLSISKAFLALSKLVGLISCAYCLPNILVDVALIFCNASELLELIDSLNAVALLSNCLYPLLKFSGNCPVVLCTNFSNLVLPLPGSLLNIGVSGVISISTNVSGVKFVSV